MEKKKVWISSQTTNCPFFLMLVNHEVSKPESENDWTRFITLIIILLWWIKSDDEIEKWQKLLIPAQRCKLISGLVFWSLECRWYSESEIIYWSQRGSDLWYSCSPSKVLENMQKIKTDAWRYEMMMLNSVCAEHHLVKSRRDWSEMSSLI